MYEKGEKQKQINGGDIKEPRVPQRPLDISEEEWTRRGELKRAWDEEKTIRGRQEEASRQQQEKLDKEATQPQARDDQAIPDPTKQDRPSGISEAEMTRRYELREAWDEENHIREQRNKARWKLLADTIEGREPQANKDQTSNLSVPGPLQEAISSKSNKDVS